VMLMIGEILTSLASAPCAASGQGISPHIDVHHAFDDGFLFLSLGSGEHNETWGTGTYGLPPQYATLWHAAMC
jgi:hypothetical protein